ncbi:MAG: glycosyltransferase [Rhodospirillaceae bacterium]|nr:glycosyltransferase [Rhodospirillaceae bacterium]
MSEPAAVSRHYAEPGFDLQRVFDAAVVMPSLLRPTIGAALRSVYAQAFSGTIQILIGIDDPAADRTVLQPALAERPPHCVVTVVDLGYSTSERRGGVHKDYSGGALRTILSYMANSRYLAYLDDDNWWHREHLASLRAAIRGADWAWSLRWFADAETGQPLCIDEWESVGPAAGVFAKRFGGWVDPNCLMINKGACEAVLAAWSLPLTVDQMTGDRQVFRALVNRFRPAATGRATTYYRMGFHDPNHEKRMTAIRARLAQNQPECAKDGQ